MDNDTAVYGGLSFTFTIFPKKYITNTCNNKIIIYLYTMNDIIIDRLAKIGIVNSKPLKRGWNRTKCPKCLDNGDKHKDLTLSFDVENGMYNCHRCNWKGNVVYQKSNIYTRPTLEENTESDEVMNFLRSRGFSDGTIRRILADKLISYGKRTKSVCFNYWKNGELLNYKTRVIGEKAFYQCENAEKSLYNIDSVKGKEVAIVVEGEMSALACIEAGLDKKYAILSLENGAGREGDLTGKFIGFKNCYNELIDIKTYIIALDDDIPGTYTGSLLIRHIGEHRCKIVKFPEGCKDPDDIINREKRGGFTAAENNRALVEVFEKAVDFPVGGIIELDENIRELLLKYKQHGRPPSTRIPIKVVDNHFSFKSGEITCVSGYANMGKSTWCMDVAKMMSMSHGWKWAIFAGEQYPQDRYFEDLAASILRKNIMEKDRQGKLYMNVASLDEVDMAYNFISDKFYLIAPEHGIKPTLEYIMEKALYLKEKYGINGIILDTFNKMQHDFGNQRDDVYLDDWFDKCIPYARQFDAFILLMHPSKPSTTKNGNISRPNIYSIAGGAMSANKLDNIIFIHRPSILDEDGMPNNSMEVIISKVRDTKSVGKLGTITGEFVPDENTYRYGAGYETFDMTLEDYFHGVKASLLTDDFEEEIPF